jgi:hypothetical protein
MNEHSAFAFSSAIDICKQMIALATGVLALEITFLKDLVPGPSTFSVGLLEASWVFLGLSVFFGLWTLSALTGTCAQESPPAAKDVYNTNIAVPMWLQWIAFLLGIALSVWFAMLEV